MLWSLTALLPVDLLDGRSTLGALAAVLAVLVAAALLRRQRERVPARVPVRAAAVRERARRTAPMRQCDPDAAGRPRPRAPAPRPPAA